MEQRRNTYSQGSHSSTSKSSKQRIILPELITILTFSVQKVAFWYVNHGIVIPVLGLPIVELLTGSRQLNLSDSSCSENLAVVWVSLRYLLSFENLQRILHPLQIPLAFGEERQSKRCRWRALKGWFFSLKSVTVFLASHNDMFLVWSIKIEHDDQPWTRDLQGVGRAFGDFL